METVYSFKSIDDLRSTGRPSMSYKLSSGRTQWRKASSLVKSTVGNIKLLIQSASAAARKGVKSVNHHTY